MIQVGSGTKLSGTCGTSTGHPFSVSYGSGSVSGTERTGPVRSSSLSQPLLNYSYTISQVTYAGLTVPNQSFGVASSSSGFTGVDGIFGFGPTDLTQGTVTGVSTVYTWIDNLYIEGQIVSNASGSRFESDSYLG